MLNPNYDETMSKDRNSDATGKSDLFPNNTLPSSLRSGTRLTERQRRGEFLYTRWSDPVWGKDTASAGQWAILAACLRA